MVIVNLPQEARQRLEHLARMGYPNETCGLLLGHVANATVLVQRVLPARNLNIERAHDRFELDPDDFMAADLEARATRLEIVGIWHSHPDHSARPSEIDRASAWQGWSYLIAAVTRDGVTDLRSWRLQEQTFMEEAIQS